MIARRQPSSVLSICMSLILLTSSVKTLKRGEDKRYAKREMPNRDSRKKPEERGEKKERIVPVKKKKRGNR